MVNGVEFLNVCARQGWDEDMAFHLLDQVLAKYAEHAAERKP